VSTVNGGGIVLPDEVESSITSAAQEATATNVELVPQVSASQMPGGVAAMPIDPSTYLQVVIPANPSFPNPSGGVSVTINARILSPAQQLTYCSWPQTFNVNSGISFASDLAPGYLLSVAVTVTTLGIPDGVIYAVVGLIHTNVVNTPNDTLLVCGYVNSRQPIGWPSGILRTTSEGAGFSTAVQPANPGAGNFLLYPTVDQYFRLLGISFTFTTSAAAGNRYIVVAVQPVAYPAVWVGVCPTAQPAGQAVIYEASVNMAVAAISAGAVETFPLADVGQLAAGSYIDILPQNLQAGDAITGATITGQAWL